MRSFGHMARVATVAAVVIEVTSFSFSARAIDPEGRSWYQSYRLPSDSPTNRVPSRFNDASPSQPKDKEKASRTPPSSKMTEQTMQEKFQSQQDQIYQAMAKKAGCWKSDGGALTANQMPDELAIVTPGYAYSFDPTVTSPNQLVQVSYDSCAVDKNTNATKLNELYCKPGSAACGVLLPKTAKECVSTLKSVPVSCPTGTGCQDTGKGAACLPLPGEAAWNGCFTGQAPFLDSDGNGVPDACACPEGMFPKDTNKDGNSDACVDRSEFCGLGDAEKTKLGVTVKAKGLEDGGWTLSDYCSTPFEVTSVVCSDLNKSKGVKSTSKKPCTPGQICKAGSCMDTNSDLCDGTNSNKDPKIKGWVTINGSSQLWDKCGDNCAAFKTDPGAYNTCIQNPGKYSDVVENVLCTSPTDSATQYYPTPCSSAEYCEDGVCKPKGGSGSGGSGGGGDKKPYDQTKPPTGPGGDNPAPKPGDSGKDAGDKPCTIEMQCSEPTDSTHPTVNGILLMGDPFLPGLTKTEMSCGGTILPGLTVEISDKCQWKEEDLLPVLTQYGCTSPQTLAPSISICDWSKKEACDWQAKKGTPQFGICQKNVPKPNVTQKPVTAAAPGQITGTNSFGHKVDHTDVCVPAQGKKAVKKWKLMDNPEGAQAYFETCPDQHHCTNGVCVPDPCLVNKDKINDKDPCTDDSCKEDTGDIFNIPVPVDDSDNCTTDKCVNDNGKAKIIHDLIDSPVCKLTKLCTEKPTDPQCTTPTTDCSKTPDDPNCKTLPPTLDCTKTPDDPKCKVPVDCGKTPDDPACLKPAKGGFSCDDPVNKDNPQCKTTQDYCYDDDPTNDGAVAGKAVLFPGTPQEKSATDTCIEFNGAQFTAVLQVSCGPNNTFFFKKSACPAQASKGCVNGACVPK